MLKGWCGRGTARTEGLFAKVCAKRKRRTKKVWAYFWRCQFVIFASCQFAFSRFSEFTTVHSFFGHVASPSSDFRTAGCALSSLRQFEVAMIGRAWQRHIGRAWQRHQHRAGGRAHKRDIHTVAWLRAAACGGLPGDRCVSSPLQTVSLCVVLLPCCLRVPCVCASFDCA